MTTFFIGWELWQKLCFCLACAIVVTVFLGVLKLLHTHRRLKSLALDEEKGRYNALAINPPATGSPQQLSSGTRGAAGHENDGDEKATAFGIRAIERGVEVEGVWISRSNTPDGSSRNGSVASSSRWQQPQPREPTERDREPAGRQPARSNRTSAPNPQTMTQMHRPSLDDQELAADSQSQTYQNVTPRGRQPRRSRQHPPSSYVKYRHQPFISRPSARATPAQSLEVIRRVFAPLHSDDAAIDTEGSTSPISASAPSLLRYERDDPPPPGSRQSSTDLEMLNRHRTSQAAEIGQLTPRLKRDTSPATCDAGPRLSVSADSHTRTRSHSISSSTPSHPAPAPSSYPVPYAPRRASLPDVLPFTQFRQRTAPTPSRSCPRQPSPPPSPPSNPASPVIPASAGATSLHPPPPFAHNPRPPALRGHGTGFEILPRGSLDAPPGSAPALTPVNSAAAAAPSTASRHPPVSPLRYGRRHRGGGGARRWSLGSGEGARRSVRGKTRWSSGGT